MARIIIHEDQYHEIRKKLSGYTITPLRNNNKQISCRINGSGLPDDEKYEVMCVFNYIGEYVFYNVSAHRVCDDLRQSSSL